jgi:exonuclease III
MAGQSIVTNNLNVYSLNCEGAERYFPYINGMLSDSACDILCLQETWLIEQMQHKLSNIHNEYLSYGKSGVDSMSEILVGRPSGGVAILYRKSMAKYVRHINTSSRRICGIVIQNSQYFSICVVSVYMPCDNYSNVTMNDDYVNVIDDIEYLIHENECNALIICGDFNTCYVRDNAQTR